MRLLAKILRFMGLIVSAVLTFVVVFTKFIQEQPARVTLSMLGVIVALVLLIIFIRFGKVWIHNKLSAMATARELDMNGKTRPLFQVLLTMFYIFYPTLILVLFLYGMAVYEGTLWFDILTMLGCITIYFVFEFIALSKALARRAKDGGKRRDSTA